MPKWGISKSEYSFDRYRNVIAKGLSSVKFISDGLAEKLYDLANDRNYEYFVDVLDEINKKTNLNTRQLDILIKIDFFSDFGNQRELLRITDMFYNTFNKGEAKKIKREYVDDSPFKDMIVPYANGMTKAGTPAKSYTLLDTMAILRSIEKHVLSLNMDDLENKIKIKNFHDAMGYYGYCTNKEEDRRKLYVLEVYPLKRKKDGNQCGYLVISQSIGSGKQSRFTVFNRVYNKDPIREGDIIYCTGFIREGQYFTLTSYYKDW